MDAVLEKYHSLCEKSSDINEHLPTLYRYAKDCSSIIECGVRHCVSSWALLYGLVENGKDKKLLLLNDIHPCPVDSIVSCADDLGVQIQTEWMSNLILDVKEQVDMVFIDTYHVYGQLKRELEHFAPKVQKYIIMHDTTIDGITSESIRNKHDIHEKMLETGFSEEEIKEGLWKAVEEFIATHEEWSILERFTNNNGLTVLVRK